MPSPSVVDPADVQLLFADLQKQIVPRSKTTSPKALGKSVAVLAELGAVFSLPMIISVVPEEGKPAVLIPELAEQVVGIEQHLRTGASPFGDVATVAALASAGRRTLVIAGFATEVVVLHAVTGAIDAGYRAIVVVDACGGMSDRTEVAALRQIEAYGGEVSSTVTIATAMAPEFSTPIGQRMFGKLQQLRLG